MAKFLVEVVGVYYREIIEAPSGSTVKVIMEQAQLGTPLQIEPGPGNQVQRITHDLQAPFETRGNRTRQPGKYSIAEIVSPEGAVAWQYYIERPEGGIDLTAYKTAIASNQPLEAQRLRKNVSFQRMSYTRAKEGFLGIDASEQCEDGDVIVWRCVAILKKEGDSNEVYAKAIANS
ncbi:MAG: hypothetical protein AAFR53_07300 [Pseudomonadota bacterium]